ncbi:unnamed protein product (macronuclear) [Paramecium tetraurelia]|uniref:Roadblock/LAMTOR2 domain-containing protein n=1 Tax=Paramecium tetraurelia TaxID=5888 RepID=A0DHQ9_PARTE|nr:uncharacterized protein GSPATT00016963001 [Paramecium tetraurelia]CAK82576.1 unnamed protein product [Paramecium tetraurelia]|eukprot:XP_001449973.1 hypothetical protein (macronuclear) [Paramecium tetraurelia strain d4-2]
MVTSHLIRIVTNKRYQPVEGANGYVIFNQDCIPLKRSEKNISYEKAVHMSALVADLWNVTKKCIQRDLRNQDVFTLLISKERFGSHQNQNQSLIRIYNFTMYQELYQLEGDYTMIGIQLCGKAIEEAKSAAAAEAQALAEAEKAKKGDKEQS